VTVREQNFVQKKIKWRLNSDNAYNHSVQNLFSSHLLLKNIMIRLCRIIILPGVLYGSETWSLILRQEHRLKAFENWLLKRMFGSKRGEVTLG
jgi:hypothetical protein